MKKWILLIIPIVFLSNVNAQDKQLETIVFMRHAEKPFFRVGQLNCQGLNRALALPKVLKNKFGKPDYIFAPNPYAKTTGVGGLYYYVRGLATIEPSAIQLGMPVNTKYKYDESYTVAKNLIASQYHHSLIFVNWEHLNIVYIAKKLMKLVGRDPKVIPDWSRSDYDSLYIITLNWEADPVEVNFIHSYQGLNNQSTHCPVPKMSLAESINRTKKIVFIPEVEPLSDDIDQISCQGLNRALALPHLLKNRYPFVKSFIIPSAQGGNYIRTLITIEPTVINYHANVTPMITKDNQFLVRFLNQNLMLNNTIIITWPFKELANLAQAVYTSNGGNASDIPNPIPSRDTIYEITIDKNPGRHTASFLQLQEHLNDRSKICP